MDRNEFCINPSGLFSFAPKLVALRCMRIGKLYRTLVAIFFVGILSSTFFMQGTGVRKKYTARSAGYSLVVKLPDASSGMPKQSPLGSGLMNEEEEEEEVHLKAEFVEISALNNFIIVCFSSAPPTLFFKEHFREVTSPPPWA